MSHVDPISTDYDSLIRHAVSRTLYEPQWFYSNILNFPAFKWQVKATDVVFDARREPEKRVVNISGKRRLSIRSCHGTGKTQFLGLLTHAHSFVLLDRVCATAPKEAQITQRLFPCIRRAMRDAVPEYKKLFDIQNKAVKIDGDPDWGLIAETASEPENLAGYHPPLFMIDEASARRIDEMYQVIEGTLTRPDSFLVEIGNPTRMEGEFYDHHNKLKVKDMYHLMHIKAEDATEIITKEFVDSYIIKYGIDSPVTKIRAFGEFASFDEAILIPVSYIEEAQDIEEVSDGSISILRVSIDVSDGGADSTQITVARHYDSFVQIVQQKGFWFKTETATLDAAEAAINMFEAHGGRKGVDQFIVDGIGVGAGTAAYLSKLGYNVVVHKGSETNGIDTHRWRNRRVMCAMKLHEMFRDRKIRISPNAIDDFETFIQHIVSVKRAAGDKVDDIESKEKVKKELGFSYDKFDSLAMQFSDIAPAGYRPQEDYKALLELNNSIPEMESANVAW